MKINKTMAVILAAAILVTGTSAVVHSAFTQDYVVTGASAVDSSETLFPSVSDKEARAFEIPHDFRLPAVTPSDETAEVYREGSGLRPYARYQGKDQTGQFFQCEIRDGEFWEITQETQDGLTVYVFVSEASEKAQISLSRKTEDGTDVYEYNYSFLCQNGLCYLGDLTGMSLERYTKEGGLRLSDSPTLPPDAEQMRFLVAAAFVNKEEVAAFLETHTFGPPSKGGPTASKPGPYLRSEFAGAKYQ